MNLAQPASRGLAVALLFCLPAAIALARAPASSPESAAATVITTADPAVPRGLGKACAVTLFHNQAFPDESGPLHFTYMPPPDCPKPWAKVILQLDISGSRHAPAYSLVVDLAGIPVFRGISPKYDAEASWHVERDLTDDVSLLGQPNDGQIFYYFSDESPSPETRFIGSAKLLFYRASAQTPAPLSPDVVLAVHAGTTALNLPHNIERAYLDVFNAVPWWFTCVPDQSFNRFRALHTRLAPGDLPRQGNFAREQGCSGVSHVEHEVIIDGTPAGIVPAFPLLSADFNPSLPNTVNQPTTPSQMLSFVPYRVDLTPFAGVLNDAGTHTLAIRQLGLQIFYPTADGQLLLYLDPGRALVVGGVTLNTLAGSSATPTVNSTLSASGDVLRGRVTTRLDRDFEIRGFVNTSHGQVHSSVAESQRFSNTQVFLLRGLADPDESSVPRLYEQNIWLSSTVHRTSRRTVGGKTISLDQERVSYPLRFSYRVEGAVAQGDQAFLVPTKASMGAHQGRFLDGDHYRAGLVRYITNLDDVFGGSRARNFLTGAPDTHWKSFREVRFGDNLGSCYEHALITHDGAIDTDVQGIDCPHDINRVRWFAHPDGSPDGLGWAH